jgi:serine protease Do
MRPLRPLILAALSLAAFSCASGGRSSSVAPPLADARLKEVRDLISSGSVLQGFQEISLLRRDAPSGLPSSEVDGLEAQASEALSAAFQKAVTEKGWDDALRYLRSASTLGRSELTGSWTEKSLLEAQAGSFDAAGERLLALLARQRAIAIGEPTEADLSAALENASELGNRAIARSLAARMRERGFAVPQLPSLGEEPPPFSQMLEGTVTIWVNRGIRIEKGVGYPDRVIGSGFFIDPRGYLLTNYHVIKSEVDPTYEGYSRLFIRFNETTGEKIPAKVVGYDQVFDLALLKAETTARYAFGGSAAERASPGDRVFAIGSPGGLEKTITSGIVSATGRRFLQMGDAMQVDVPLNPGNSGGPLLSEKGGLIGIAFAGLEQFEGINFAVPYLWIEKALPLLFRGGKAVHPWLGAALAETDKGLEVLYTLPDSPAARAGLASGDILMTMNGAPYTTLRDAQEAILSFAPPSLVRVGFSRGASVTEAILCLAERPQSPIETALKKDTRDTVLYPLFGMKLERTKGALWRNSFVVKRVTRGSVADEAGLSENDPLTIQDWKVDNEKGYAVLQLYVKKRKSGFIESVVQIASYLETDNFL